MKRYLVVKDFGFIPAGRVLSEDGRGHYFLSPPIEKALRGLAPWAGTIRLHSDYVEALPADVLSLIPDEKAPNFLTVKPGARDLLTIIEDLLHASAPPARDLDDIAAKAERHQRYEAVTREALDVIGGIRAGGDIPTTERLLDLLQVLYLDTYSPAGPDAERRFGCGPSLVERYNAAVAVAVQTLTEHGVYGKFTG